MKAFVKNTLKKVFPKWALHYKAYQFLINNKDSYLYRTGWMQSLAESKPKDKNHKPIPWMNFPVVTFLEERLKNNLNLFEYGSGFSTLFFAKRVKTVTSLEYDKNWFSEIQSTLPQNVELIFCEKDIDGDYCRAIQTKQQLFDIVIIDGRDRVNCLIQSIPCLSEQGIILLDDSHRQRYQEGLNFAKQQGFRSLSIEGLKATGSINDRSTILYRDNNCLGI